MLNHQEFMRAAYEQAMLGLSVGGLPIGSVMAIDGEIIAKGHNQRIQRGSSILHAEMDCLEKAGRLTSRDYQRAVLYSTLSPCDMCSGAILLYKIPTVIVGENRNFQGPESYVRSRGVDVQILDAPDCVAMMEDFIRRHPTLWNEDIGI
jgi:cytosine deaminase